MTTSIRESSAVTPTRYTGKPCPKHPDLEGLRMIRNYACVGCVRDARNKARISVDRVQLRSQKIQRIAEAIAAHHGVPEDWTSYADLAAEIYELVSRGTQTSAPD